MKKILYLTTALEEKDYDYYLEHCYPISNPSNQNFHSNAINALKKEYEVLALTLVPFETKSIRPIDNPTHIYIEHPRNIIQKILALQELKEEIKALPKDFSAIIYDPLNEALSRMSSYAKKILEVPRFAFLTDNPFNITSMSAHKARTLISLVRSSEGAISLTSKLLEIYGLKEKPHEIIEGLAIPSKSKPYQSERPYFYFGGTLLEKYGVKLLIEAFQKANLENLDLYIAGHRKEKLPISKNVHFLGQVTKEENAAYQKGAYAVINPRPFSKKLDAESIPSKMFEYIANANRVISTKNTFFEKNFPNDIMWIGEGNADDFSIFFENLKRNGLSSIPLLDPFQKQKFLSLYGESSFNQKITSLLDSLPESDCFQYCS